MLLEQSLIDTDMVRFDIHWLGLSQTDNQLGVSMTAIVLFTTPS